MPEVCFEFDMNGVWFSYKLDAGEYWFQRTRTASNCNTQAYHLSRICRDNSGLKLTVPVADEYLTWTLRCPV